MALKFKYKTKDEVPAEVAGLYAEREGEWVLDCDGVAEKTKLDEFRTSNAALAKRRSRRMPGSQGVPRTPLFKLASMP